MKLKPRPVLLILSILIIIFFIFFLRIKHSPKTNDVNNQVTVAVSKSQQKDVLLTSQVIGTVQAYSSVALKSRVDGEVLNVNFKEGDMVQQGQLLATIDPRLFQVQLNQALANLARDQAQLDNANFALRRGLKLAPQGYISKQDLDQLTANQKGAAATVKADQAAVDSAKLQLSYTTIYAPITGRTGNVLIKPGNLIKANDTSPLVTINQVTPIYVVFSIPQQQLYIIRQELNQGPLTLTVYFDKQQISSETGILTFIDNTVDTTTGTIQMKGTFANPKQILWPGQFVTVSVPLGQLKQAIVVPTLAVQAGPDGNFIFVINAEQKAVVRKVEVGSSVGDETVISSGLKAGETVVTEGQLRLIDGASVRIVSNS